MSALWLLLRLQFGGWWRFLLRNVQTLRGALLMVLTFSVMLPGFVMLMIMPRLDTASGLPADQIVRYGPLGLLAYVILGVLLSPSSQPIYFTPAEVQFLFAGPFSRRQILAYKVMLSLLVSVPTSVMLSLIVRVRDGWLVGILLGVLFMTTFLVLFSIVLGLLAAWLGASLHTRARQWMAGLGVSVLVALLLYAGAVADWDLPQMVQPILDSTLWKTFIWPLTSFFQLLTAQSWAELGLPLLVAVGLNVLMVVLLFGLDAQFLEQSAAGSAALYARILRARGLQVNVEPLEGKERRRAWTLPNLPYLGGLGPVAWRQMLSGIRSTGRMAGLLLLMGLALVGPIVAQFGGAKIELILGTLVGIGFWLSIMLPVMVPFDFRGDIDRMGTLKMYPIAPWRLALGQMIAPAVFLTVAHTLLLVGVAIAVPDFVPYLGMALVVVPAFNLYVIAVENVLFLLFPTRIVAATPGDFQTMGSNILLSFAKAIALSVPAMLGGLGFLVGYLSGWPWLGVLIGESLLLAVIAGLVAAAGWAFTHFDVGRTTPA